MILEIEEALAGLDNPQELVGMKALWKHGTINNCGQSIVKVVNVTSKHFMVEGSTSKFSLVSGSVNFGRDRIHWGSLSECKILTGDSADKLMVAWGIQKVKRQKIAEIAEIGILLPNLMKLPVETLDEILKLMNS